MSLFSYRVFPKGANASNFDIARAIDAAREQGCDLINLSLGRPADLPAASDEPLVRFALEDAREAGILTIAAAGNDFRKGVSIIALSPLVSGLRRYMAERYIVRFRGSAPAKEIIAQLHADPDVQVVEETPRMVLVEANESMLLRVLQSGHDVAIVPERHYNRPDSRPSIIPDPSDKGGDD